MAGSNKRRRSKAGVDQPSPAVAPAFSGAQSQHESQFAPEFWSHFTREHWERQPLFIPKPFSRPLIREAEIFRAVLDACTRFCQEREDVPLAFYIEHARQVASVVDYLPVAADKNMVRYASRISRTLRGQRFALIVEDIQAYAPELWWRFREFLGGLDDAVPRAGVNRKATVFIGNYAMTPSGLHVGTSGNFKFIISGRKRMRLWSDDFFRNQRGVNHTVHIERFLPAATTLECRAGDVLYWPSDQWHVGEAVGGLAVSVSLAVFIKSRAGKPAAGASERRIAAWLNRKTGGGFHRVPTPLPHRILADHRRVRCDPRFPILWQTGDDGAIICSANGRAFAVKADEEIPKLLARLNSGDVCQVSELIATRSSLRALLEKLRQLRAIFEVDDSGD